MDDIQDVYLRASFSSFSGNPISLVGMITTIENKTMLVISHEDETPVLHPESGYYWISDLKGVGADTVFTQEMFIDAYEAYRLAKNMGLIEMDNSLKKHEIDNHIQVDGMKDSGRFNYNINSEVKNATACILAMGQYFGRYNNNQQSLRGIDKLFSMMQTI